VHGKKRGDRERMIISAAVVVLLALALAFLRVRKHAREGALTAHSPPPQPSDESAAPPPAFTTEALQNMHDECMKFAFGVGRFDYLILGEHATVLEHMERKLGMELLDHRYLPRRPLLLPKLLQALQDDETTRKSLAGLIMQDPALAGRVIQRANSAFYRPSPQPVENLDRAVSVLGTRGLRALMPDVILQPVFRLPAGYFGKFAPTTWDLGQRAGQAAECLAREAGTGDPLVAQLLALIASLSRVVLFRMTVDEYKTWPEVLPRAEVFIRVLQHYAPAITVSIARSWELLDASIVACEEQAQQITPSTMTPLGRTLYFGQLTGSLAMLVGQQRYSEEGAIALLKEQGLGPGALSQAWQAASQLET
jgi:HD-like signal output (HDOD) protein